MPANPAKLVLTPGQPNQAKLTKRAKRVKQETNTLDAQPAIADPIQTRGRGRPSSYSEEIADEICEYVALGRSLVSYCAQPGKPCMTSVFKWLKENEVFAETYTRARECQADAYVDQLIDIARSSDDPNNKRVVIDTMKWVAGKQRPKKYGDRSEVQHSVGFTSEFESFIREINERRLAKQIEARELKVITVQKDDTP